MQTTKRHPALRALVATAIIGGAAATGAMAAPPPSSPPTAFETTPPSLNFGSVPVESASVKPVKMINRTKETLYYQGAQWPNFGNPAGWLYPYGFWNVSGSGPDFPCYEIAPRSSCTLNFRFLPKETGTFSTIFTPTYGNGGGSYTDTTAMRGTGIAPVPPT